MICNSRAVVFAMVAALFLLGCGSFRDHSTLSGQDAVNIVLPPCSLQEYRADDAEGSFVDYWVANSLGQSGLATINRDGRDGSFSIVSRTMIDEITLRYDVFYRVHRTEDIGHQIIYAKFDKRDHVAEFLDEIQSMICKSGSTGGLVTMGGPYRENHLVLESGHNVFIPSFLIRSAHFNIQNALYKPIQFDKEIQYLRKSLAIARVELVIGVLDAQAQFLPPNISDACRCSPISEIQGTSPAARVSRGGDASGNETVYTHVYVYKSQNQTGVEYCHVDSTSSDEHSFGTADHFESYEELVEYLLMRYSYPVIIEGTQDDSDSGLLRMDGMKYFEMTVLINQLMSSSERPRGVDQIED